LCFSHQRIKSKISETAGKICRVKVRVNPALSVGEDLFTEEKLCNSNECCQLSYPEDEHPFNV